MNRKLLVPAVVVLAVLVIAGIAVVLGGGDDGDEDDTAAASPTPTATVPGTIVPGVTPSPTPTLETAPDPTETPVPDPEAQARNLELVPAPAGLLEFVTDGPYVVPGDAIGAFYLNIQTQQVEGWYALIEGTQFIAFSGEGRYTLFWRKNQVTSGNTIYPAGFYLADRQSRTVYRWEGDAEPAFEKTAFPSNELTARGDLVLFRVPDDDDASWFSLVNVATREVETAFAANAQWAFISDDAGKIALAGRDVIVADVDSGRLERAAEDVIPDLTGPASFFEPGKWANVEFVETTAADSFVITATDLDEPGSSGQGGWWRIDWEDGLVAEGEGVGAYVSPDGELVAVTEALADTDINVGYHTVTAYQTEDGEPLFRVVGADETYAWPEHDRWLADGSGFIVQTPAGSPRLANASGLLQDFPGVPSPDSPNVFARHLAENNSFGVFDANGIPLVTLSFQGGVRDFVDPWGDSGDEVRMLIPHLGHGGSPSSATVVEPYVEQAPFEDEAALQLSEIAVAFGLLDLFDEPAGDTVVGQVMDPHRVVLQELAMVCSDGRGSETCPETDSTLPYEFMALVRGDELTADVGLTSYWARVTTPDGQEGWILLQVSVQGA